MEIRKPKRRLAAILAADVVGYSAMMSADEAGTLAQLKECENNIIQPVVADHSGRIVKKMGDGYLVEFASVVSAVDCAVSWQEKVAAPLAFRIGINVGEVIIDDDDLYGEGVNIAARLEALAETGGICLSVDAWRQSNGKTEAHFEDLGPKQLKNIAEPLRVFRLVTDKPSLSGEVPESAPRNDVQSAWRPPSIMLASFRHLGSNSDAEDLASGLTETLASALAHFEEFELIDPGSAMHAISKFGALEAGRQLGAVYTLEGTIQLALQKIRIGVQLVEVSSGQRVWSDTLDRSLDDVFELQDDITAYVASTMSDAVGEEQAKAILGKSDSELTPHEKIVRGLQLLHRVNSDDNKAARKLFESVLWSDPYGMFPKLCLCWTYAVDLQIGWTLSREDALEYSIAEMLDLMRRYPRSAHLHRLMSRLRFFEGDYGEGVAHAERAFELNPYHSDMMTALGMARLWNGEPAQAMVHLERAFATNQYAPDVYKNYLALGCFLLGRFEEALKLLSSSETSESVTRLYRILNLVGADQVEKAKNEVLILLKEQSDFDVDRIHSLKLFRRIEDREQIASALRVSGLLG
ncbi:MAG: adenylate/guanylate cyclase domain-containing protein [Pseudomonadota bacterium]